LEKKNIRLRKYYFLHEKSLTKKAFLEKKLKQKTPLKVASKKLFICEVGYSKISK